jgi:hypothetical protein
VQRHVRGVQAHLPGSAADADHACRPRTSFRCPSRRQAKSVIVTQPRVAGTAAGGYASTPFHRRAPGKSFFCYSIQTIGITIRAYFGRREGCYPRMGGADCGRDSAIEESLVDLNMT